MNRYGLLCTKCSTLLPFRYKDMKCACGGTLLVAYDLERIARTRSKDSLRAAYPSMWKYADLLPVARQEHIVTLGEGWTPLLRLSAWERKLPLRRLWVKREEQNPTGSFKARGFSAAISLLKEAGIGKVAVPSNGNAAGAMAAYAARAGMEAHVFVPKDCPPLIVQESVQYGASVFLVDGFIHDAARIIEAGMQEQGWFNVGTLKEAGRVEGKKTMGLELAEQLGWRLPDVIMYPTGGGSGIIGMWKAFQELLALGWLESSAMPRMVCVQEAGCQPIVDACARGAAGNPGRAGSADRGADDAGSVGDADSVGSTGHVGGTDGMGGADDAPDRPERGQASPTGMRVPRPPDLGLIASIIGKSQGTAVAVTSEQIADAQACLGSQGVSASPEGAATWAGLLALCEQGWIRPEDEVVLFNTSHALKYVDFHELAALPVIRDYADFTSARK